MDFLTLFLLAATVAATAALIWPRRGVVRFCKHRVVVHTKAGASIQGVLIATHGDCIELHQPRYLAENADLEGEAIVLKADIHWLQILGGDER